MDGWEGEQITKEHENGHRMSPVLVISQARSVVIEPVCVAAASGGNLRILRMIMEGKETRLYDHSSTCCIL